jgi:hypothetical protein
MKFAIKICGLCGMKLCHVGEKPSSNISFGELHKTALRRQTEAAIQETKPLF